MTTIRYGAIVQIQDRNRWQFFSQQAWKEGEETPLTDSEYLAACQQIAERAKLRLMPLNAGESYPMVHAGTLMDEEVSE